MSTADIILGDSKDLVPDVPNGSVLSTLTYTHTYLVQPLPNFTNAEGWLDTYQVIAMT